MHTRVLSDSDAAFVRTAPPSGSAPRPTERHFWRCETCALVFVARDEQFTEAAERAVYELHENSANDPRYRAFLSQLFVPLRERVGDGAAGLDFGCGPGPTLSAMFRESGVPCADYDPFFFNDPTLLTAQYDFIASTEVFEHLSDPASVIAALVAMLKPGGWLGVMTRQLAPHETFANWHYIRDPTHVAFYDERTFAWIGSRYGLLVERVSRDVVLMQRRTGGHKEPPATHALH